MTTQIDVIRSNFNFIFEADHFLRQSASIIWRDAAGDDVLWLMNNNIEATITALPKVTPSWHVRAAADFDGDLNADLLWQNDNGALVLWHGTGNGFFNDFNALPNPGPIWHVVGDNDFDGDLVDDILWQNDNGSLAIWTGISAVTGTVGGMFAGTQNPGPTWHVVGTGDTNLDLTNVDSAAGILWQNDNGALVLWEDPTFAAGTFTFNTLAALPTVDPSWHVKGMADINGDHFADIVFQNDNGAVVIWEMDGTTIKLVPVLLLDNPGPAWHIVGLRDLNGDRNADILFQNDNGAAAVWENFQSFPSGSPVLIFDALSITPNPNPNGHVWDLL